MEKLILRTKSTPSPQCCVEKTKRGFLARALERCRSSFPGRQRPTSSTLAGCFPVLVGPGKERFAVRAELANHPLFWALLEEAEAEHGSPRAAAGPLVLPCTAEEFRQVMAEVERNEDEAATTGSAPRSPVGRLFLQGGARAGYRKMMSPARADAS